jgi:hypothetical protein
MRDLKQNACPVAGAWVAPLRPSVSEVVQDFQALLNDGMGFSSLQVGDEADAAPIFLEFRIVESLPFRKTWDVHLISYSLRSGSLFVRTSPGYS